MLSKSEKSVLRFLVGNPGKSRDVIIRSVNRSGGSALARLVRVGAIEVTDSGAHNLTDAGRSMLSEGTVASEDVR